MTMKPLVKKVKGWLFDTSSYQQKLREEKIEAFSEESKGLAFLITSPRHVGKPFTQGYPVYLESLGGPHSLPGGCPYSINQ